MSSRLVLFAALVCALAFPADAAEHGFKLGTAYPGTTFTPDREDVAVSNGQRPGNGLLLVVLPAIGTAPSAYGRLMHAAADDGGYHALALDWVSGFETDARGTNIFYQCDHEPCFEGVWQEEFDGSDQVPKVRIGPTDSVLNRLVKALTYLAHTWPDEGWGAFLADDQPVWSKIAIAGHANGAGEAAYIASRFTLARVALFSGPLDSTGDGPDLKPASWLSAPHATPASLWYAFGSTRDTSRTLNRTERYSINWPALGLGQPLNTDGLVPPFNGAHALLTSLAPCDGCTPSNMTATDQTPLDAAGTPVFRPIWDTMLGIVAGN